MSWHWVQRGAAAELSAGRSNREILKLVKQGVGAELGAAIGTSGVSAAQGAAAAVDAGDALAGISGQLTALAAQVAALAGTGYQQPVR